MRTILVLATLTLCALAQGRLPVLGATILYPEGRRASAFLYHDAYREARARVRRVTGALPPQGVSIELVEDAAALTAALGKRGAAPVPRWVAGVALPGHQLIVIRLDLRTPAPARVEGLLAHELCHIVAHHVVSSPDATPIPRWLDEGLAQHAEGRVFSPEAANLAMRAFFGQLLSLSELERSFPRTEGASALAYAQSESFVNWLAKTGPTRQRLPRLLAALRQGHSVKRAVRDIFLRSIDELEADWRSDLRSDRSWMPAAIGQLLVGALIAVVVVMGASRIVLRRRALRTQWEHEEADEGGDDPAARNAPPGQHPTGRRPPIRRLRGGEDPPGV